MVGIIQINRVQLYPSKAEIGLLRRAYGDIDIHNIRDLISIQNRVLELNKHTFVSSSQFNLKQKLYKGECYDRSIILQKILIYNKISLRPLFLYFGGPTNSPLDIFSSNLKSHSVFEFRWGNEYFIMKTNTKMFKLQKLEEYLKEANWSFPKNNVNYLRYVFNRNGRLLAPSYLPDIYYFNF
jgi:hypothetical protein